jgi:hypothetical protein
MDRRSVDLDFEPPNKRFKSSESDWSKFTKQWRENYKREHNVDRLPSDWMRHAMEAFKQQK